MRDGHLRWFGCVEQKHFDCTGGQLLGEGGDGLMYVEGFTRQQGAERNCGSMW